MATVSLVFLLAHLLLVAERERNLELLFSMLPKRVVQAIKRNPDAVLGYHEQAGGATQEVVDRVFV